MGRTTPISVAVVDDDENLCRSLGRLLRAAGIQPSTYASAEAFLGDTKHPQFDCLVLDIQLGGMSGIELAQRLHHRSRRFRRAGKGRSFGLCGLLPQDRFWYRRARSYPPRCAMNRRHPAAHGIF
jgi:CheY-like chemotaxis protein